MKRAEKRGHLIDVAARLFNQYGYRATGIDEVIAESGIAKTTLYRHFDSKEDLIVAVLDRVDERFRDDMRAFVEALSDDPAEQLIATFDYLRDWFKSRSFYGCPFINAAGEYSDRKNPVFHSAILHKKLMVAYFKELARAAGLKEPAKVAEAINLLHEGAIAVAHITGKPTAANDAKRTASEIIDASRS